MNAITARLNDEGGDLRGYCRVPILFDGLIPDVPKVIRISGQIVATLLETVPLTYTIVGTLYDAEAFLL